MEGSQSRRMLRASIDSYLNLLSERNVNNFSFTSEELDKMSDADLQRVLRSLRDIARTPIS